MYTYSIFSVKSEIAVHYFYKTSVLFRFFKEFKECPRLTYLQLQYNYVIEPLQLSLVAAYLRSLTDDVNIEKKDKYIQIFWEGKSLTIYEDGHHIELTCSSIQEAEEFFFPILRDSPGFYFVINNRLNDYGWLSVKNNKLINNQIFFSYP